MSKSENGSKPEPEPEPDDHEQEVGLLSAAALHELRCSLVTSGIIAGKGYRQIAEEIRMSPRIVEQMAAEAFSEAKRELDRGNETWIWVHMLRCEAMIGSLMPKALDGVPRAHDEIRTWMRLEMELLGIESRYGKAKSTDDKSTLNALIFASDDVRAQSISTILDRLRQRADAGAADYDADQDFDLRALPETQEEEQ